MKEIITLISLIILSQANTFGQCTNAFKFPSQNIEVLPFLGEQSITDFQYAGDYFIVENLIIGKTYTVSSSNNLDYFTIRDVDGLTLFENGNTPLSFVPTESTFSIHINLASPNCGSESTFRATSISCTNCDNVPSKVGVASNEPEAILDINGEIKIGSSGNVPKAGMIRWNEENSDFEGYNGTEWISFTKSDSKTWGQTSSTEGTENNSATAIDGSNNDNIGHSVSIMGDYAVVGSPYADVNGNSNQGAAYIFFYNDGEWVEQEKIVAADGVANDQFGEEVYIAGNFIIVGVRNATINSNTNQGAAYIYHREGESWVQQAKIYANIGGVGDRFGTSVAVNSDFAIVGAPFYNSPSYFDNGVVFVFERLGNSWSQSQIIEASDINSDTKFGIDVDLSDNYSIIGTFPGEFSPFYSDPSVYIFQKVGSNWLQQDQFTAAESQFEDSFGSIVTIEGDNAAVSAIEYNINGNISQGAVFTFERQGSSWNEVSKLFMKDGSDMDQFGSSIDISNDELIIGTPKFDSEGLTSSGIAIVYRKQGNSWIEVSRIKASDSMDMDNFGYGVGVHSNHSIISAPNKDIPPNADQGKVYFVKKN